jgi:hypothetical protein
MGLLPSQAGNNQFMALWPQFEEDVNAFPEHLLAISSGPIIPIVACTWAAAE